MVRWTTGISWLMEFILPVRQQTARLPICSCPCARAKRAPTATTVVKTPPRTPLHIHLSATVATTTVTPFGRKLNRKPKGDSPEHSDLLSALPLPTRHSRQLDLQWFKVALSLTQSRYPAHHAGTLNISSTHPSDRWRHVSLDKAKWPCPMSHTRPVWWTFPYSRHSHPNNNRGLMTFPRTPSPDLRNLPMPPRIPRTRSASYVLAGDTRLSRVRAGSLNVLHVSTMVILLVHAH